MIGKGLIIKGKLGWDCPSDRACWVIWSYYYLERYNRTWRVNQYLINFCTDQILYNLPNLPSDLFLLINFCTDQILYSYKNPLQTWRGSAKTSHIFFIFFLLFLGSIRRIPYSMASKAGQEVRGGTPHIIYFMYIFS